MTAAETKFPNPPASKPSWLSLAQAVFNRQAGRWDNQHCGGGLRWQFNFINPGYMDKNAISNGCFFQLAARLARYTKNDTYAQWANRAFDWMDSSPLISKKWEVFDSLAFTEQACATEPGPVQWTYNIGTMIAGSAFVRFLSPYKTFLIHVDVQLHQRRPKMETTTRWIPPKYSNRLLPRRIWR